MTHRRAVAMAAIVAATLTGCADAAGDRAAPPSGVQSCGRDIVFDAPPERVLALGAEAPSLLVAAGAGDTLTHYAGALDLPFGAATPFVERAEHLGEQRDLSVEAIIGTGVDVVISSSSITTATEIDSFVERLDQAGIQLLIVSGYCSTLGDTSLDALSGFELVYRDIETYGQVFGTAGVATAAIADLRDRVTQVERRDRSGTTAIALYVVPDGPLGGYGNKALVAEQMTVLRLDNVFGDVAERYFEPNTEQILSSDPGLVIALYIPGAEEESAVLENDDQVIDELRSRPELETIIEGARIVPLDYYYTSPSPLAVDGLELLADQLSGG